MIIVNIIQHIIIPDFINSIYPMPVVNGFYGISSYGYRVIYAEFLSIILLGILWKATLSFKKGAPPLSRIREIKSFIFSVCIFFLFSITLVETLVYTQRMIVVYPLHSENTYEENIKMIESPPVYMFVKGCRSALTKKFLSGKLISEGLRLGTERILAYALYPSINIRSQAETDQPDCLVYFRQPDAERHVPAGYEIIYRSDPENLLAIKKGVLGNP